MASPIRKSPSHKAKSMSHTESIMREDPEELLHNGQAVLKGKLYPNMDDLPELGLSTVIANVEGLFRSVQSEKPGDRAQSRVYSTVGPVLVAVNPFEQLPCYGQEWADTFRTAGEAGEIDTAWQKYGPHCFCTIEQVYQCLRKNPKQAVVICGESGAGKTVTNKIMMEYLLKTDTKKELVRRGSCASWSGDTGVTSGYLTKLASSNTLLESFGNAKTVRNDNSSRFGKFSLLSLAGDPLEVCSLAIEHYLLERSRVVDPPQGERNFHIMHQLAERHKEGASYFNYVKKVHGTTKADGSAFDNGAEFAELEETMKSAGFEDETTACIFKYIEAVLFLGNVEFEPAGDSSKVMASSAKDLGEAASRLGVAADKLGNALCQVFISTPQGKIMKDVGVEQARQQRESVAKMLYSRIFDWIVRIIDLNLAKGKGTGAVHSIGLLDIFGFEDMPINMFEQMFINLTNEQIQLLFNTVMVEKELEIYRQEGIESIFKVPPSTQPCLDLFMADKPQGIIAIMAEQLRAPGHLEDKDGTHLVDKMNRNFEQHSHFFAAEPGAIHKVIKEKEKKWNKSLQFFHTECFQIKHYAGMVTYTVREFLPRSVDNIEGHIVELMEGATEEHIQDILAEGGGTMASEPSQKRVKRLTVGEKFVQQLKSLSEELISSQCIFVRCIKPTPTLLPQRFDPGLVLEQLKCGGVVAALEIRKAGLPDRLLYSDFMDEYWPLEYGDHRQRSKNKPANVRCHDVLKGFIPLEEERPLYALGRTRAFFRTGVLALLRRFLSFKISFAARVVQRLWRIKCGRKLLYDIERQQKRLADDTADARSKGFLGMGKLRELIDTAEKILNTNYAKVKDYKAHHSDTEIKKHLDDSCLEVAASIDPHDIIQMWQQASAVTQMVKDMSRRRAETQGALDALLVEWKRGLDTALRKLDELAQSCDGSGDDEVECKKRATEARAKVAGLLKEGPPKVVALLGTLDFSEDIPQSSLEIPQDLRTETAACEAAVAEAQRLGDDILRRKLEAQEQALEANPEVKSMKQQADSNSSHLTALWQQLELKGDGELFKEARSAVSNAMAAHKEMSKLWARAGNFEVFTASVRKCVELNAAAEEAWNAALALGDSSASERVAKVVELLAMLPSGSALRTSTSKLSGVLEQVSSDMAKAGAKEKGVAAVGAPLWADFEHRLGAVKQSLQGLSITPPEGEEGEMGLDAPRLQGWVIKAPVSRFLGLKQRRLLTLYSRTFQWSTGYADLNRPRGVLCLEEGMEVSVNGGFVSLKGKRFTLTFAPEADGPSLEAWVVGFTNRLDALYDSESAGTEGAVNSYAVGGFAR